MSKEKSVVDWLFKQMPLEYASSVAAFEVFSVAEKMFEQQILDAYTQGADDEYEYHVNPHLVKREDVDAKKYYNETFNNQQP